MESEEPTDQAGEEHLAGPFHTSFGEKTSRSQIQNRRSPVCASSAEGRPTGRPARISASPPRLVNTVRGGAAKGRRPSTRIIAQGHSAEIGPIDSESAQRMDNTPRPNPPVEKDWAGPPHPCGQDGGDPSRHRRPRSGADTRDVSPDRASNSPRSPGEPAWGSRGHGFKSRQPDQLAWVDGDHGHARPSPSQPRSRPHHVHLSAHRSLVSAPQTERESPSVEATELGQSQRRASRRPLSVLIGV